MKYCAKCDKEYDDELNFCSSCGNHLSVKPQEYFCPTCGKSLGETFDNFCPYCGTRFNDVDDNAQQTTFVSEKSYSNNLNESYDNAEIKSKNHFSFSYIFSKECMLSYSGRRARMGYWCINLLLTAILGLSDALVYAIFNYDTALYASAIIGLIIIYPIFCNMSKRMHDLDKPTSWAVILALLGAAAPFYPMAYVAVIIGSIYPAFFRGTVGANQYGEDPTGV